jgi:hypothetical protein
MLSFNCALEGPSIPFDAEKDQDGDTQTTAANSVAVARNVLPASHNIPHDVLKPIAKKKRANNVPGNFLLQETHCFNAFF